MRQTTRIIGRSAGEVKPDELAQAIESTAHLLDLALVSLRTGRPLREDFLKQAASECTRVAEALRPMERAA